MVKWSVRKSAKSGQKFKTVEGYNILDIRKRFDSNLINFGSPTFKSASLKWYVKIGATEAKTLIKLWANSLSLRESLRNFTIF